MMAPLEELRRLRTEARKLRQHAATIERAHKTQRERADILTKKVAAQREKIKTLTQEKEELKKEITELKSRLNLAIDKAKTYAGMMFKSNIRKLSTGIGRGGIPRHHGNSRTKPERIDREISVFLTKCTDCGTTLNQTPSVDERIVEDIPHVQTVVTKYAIQRQWCTACHKEVRAIPEGTIPGSRFGVNTLGLVLCLKYRLRTPLAKIAEILNIQYGLSITSQGIQELLNATKVRFTKQYDDILTEIRNAPMKHADETGWRINGVNGWCWLFATPTAALYTIEETRGKDVPHRILGHDPTGVLVRDDCPSYFSLQMPQQSCWAHLLRVSHDAATHEKASEEMQGLHRELARMFAELDVIVQEPYRPRLRKRCHDLYLARIDAIIARSYTHDDVKAVQTRIANQRGNLITALLYAGVPLTNNHAERMIRPMVITRKISGGSQSDSGAATHAVNMSVMQTIALKGQSFLDEITKIIHAGNPRYALGKG
jgi:transposase